MLLASCSRLRKLLQRTRLAKAMFFRVEFSTYDTELINVLIKAKGKKPYLVEKALLYFLSSQVGKETVDALLSEKRTKATKKLEPKKAKKQTAEPFKEKTILIDKFL